MGENTHQNCARQNKNKEDPGRQQPCWGLLFCTNLTQPTGNLDSKATKDVMELFQMLNETQNATILMVTHDSFVASYCKRVLIIKDGQLYQELVSGGNRRAFQQEIADAMSLLGGEPRDII